ncbi:MAG: YfcE family phosphodiesterase [Promethearchaeota archaeon]
MRILCIGDSHIPNRAKDLPEQLYNKLNDLSNEEIFDYTFFTGDIINYPELIEYLKLKTKNDFFIVMGNMDYYFGNRDFPMYQQLKIILEDNSKLIIGLTHGAQIKPRGDQSQLEKLAIENSYQILISGHTHKEEISLTKKGVLLINPGSATGAWSFIASGNPSFVELVINKKTKEIEVNLFQKQKHSQEINQFNYYYILKNKKIQSKY